MLSACDRIVVMRDGKVVMADVARNFDRAKLVGAMGGIEPEAPRAQAAAAIAARGETPVVVRMRPERQTDDRELVAHEGEIIGLAGLAGHGQTDLLARDLRRRLASARGRNGQRAGRACRRGPAVGRRLSGMVDRPQHRRAVAEKIALRPAALAPPRRRARQRWRERIKIRTPDVHNNILSLSGGNQQKALFARALASDARIMLMDDPMRGVDFDTKLEVYDLIRAEARAGAPSFGTRPRSRS